MSTNPSTLPDITAHLLLDDPQEWAAFGRQRQPSGVATPAQPAAQAAAGEVVGAASDAVWESNVVLEGMHCAA
mgnify:FL=1